MQYYSSRYLLLRSGTSWHTQVCTDVPGGVILEIGLHQGSVKTSERLREILGGNQKRTHRGVICWSTQLLPMPLSWEIKYATLLAQLGTSVPISQNATHIAQEIDGNYLLLSRTFLVWLVEWAKQRWCWSEERLEWHLQCSVKMSEQMRKTGGQLFTHCA